MVENNTVGVLKCIFMIISLVTASFFLVKKTKLVLVGVFLMVILMAVLLF